MIRPATHEDIATVAALGQRFFKEAGWSDVAEWDDASIRHTLGHLIDGEGGILLVAEHDGRIVGMTGGLVHPLYFNHSQLTGQELFWWVDPEHRKGIGAALLDRLEVEARARGASSWAMIALDKVRPEAVGAVYRRRGYRAAEHSYIKRL